MTEHELQHWLERHRKQLNASDITTTLSRGPTLGSGRGDTWISFQSKETLARVVLTRAGQCTFTATNRSDSEEQMSAHEEFTTSGRLDEALASLVGHLT